jgi:hypothetical protein
VAGETQRLRRDLALGHVGNVYFLHHLLDGRRAAGNAASV